MALHCIRRPCFTFCLLFLLLLMAVTGPSYLTRPTQEDLAPPPVQGRRPAPRKKTGATDVKAPGSKKSSTGQRLPPSRDTESYERQRALFQLMATWTAAKPYSLPDTFNCGWALRDVCFGEDSKYITAPTCAAPLYQPPGAGLSLCSIDTTAPVAFTMPLSRDIPTQRRRSRPDPNEAVAYAAFVQLFRPQHAMQSFFSLAGAFAFLWHIGAVGDNGAPPWVPVLYAIAEYGSVNADADLRDTRRYPHMELFFKVLGDKAEMVDLSHTGVNFIKPHLAGVEITSRCYKSMAFGVLPQRLPSAVNMRHAALPASAINVTHYRALRQRIVTAFDVWEAPRERYVLLVQRRTAGRRILNVAELEKAVQRGTRGAYIIKHVSWEDLSLTEQLSLAIHAHGIVGAHGNGLAWQCLMRPGSFVIELSSRVQDKNEVTPGIDEINAGNIAPICGMKSLSLRCAYEANTASRAAPHQEWKEVDLVVGQEEVHAIESFLKR